MQSLTEKLYNKNVIFSYYGFIDNSVLEQVLRITKSKLEINGESQPIVARVYDAINNCVENIIEHNFFPGDAILKVRSPGPRMLLAVFQAASHAATWSGVDE